MLSEFVSVAGTKCLDKSKFREKGFIVAYGSREDTSHCGREEAQQQEPECQTALRSRVRTESGSLQP